MYQNPYALKAGEKLSPEELLERYLDWTNYAREVEAWKWNTSCDWDLHKSWLCCEDHLRYQLEMNHFHHYFVHHFMQSPLEPGFSLDSMIEVIHNLELQITPQLKEKLHRFWGLDADRFFSRLRI